MGVAGELAELRLDRLGPPWIRWPSDDHRDGQAQQRQQGEAA